MRKAHIRGRDAVVFNVRMNVFVMGMRTLERWGVGVRLGVIPIELFFPLPDFMPVPIQHEG